MAPLEEFLFQRARQGDPCAISHLQASVDAPLRRFIRRLIGQHQGTDDIVVECFQALYLNLERLSSSESVRPFVYRVARNLCYSELRRQGRFETVSLDAIDSPCTALVDRQQQPDVAVTWAFMLAELENAIDRLPELQRQTLILFVEEGLTYQQIAETMGTDIGTVKSRMHYARKGLRYRLSQDTCEAFGLA